MNAITSIDATEIRIIELQARVDQILHLAQVYKSLVVPEIESFTEAAPLAQPWVKTVGTGFALIADLCGDMKSKLDAMDQ